MFPVRFRHLSGDSSFGRWDWVKYRYTRPSKDDRIESCRVHEESLERDGRLSKTKQAAFLNPHVLPSINDAVARGQSLALIRPKNTRFRWKRKSAAKIQVEKAGFERAAAQTSLFDKELAALEPTPFEFRFKFEDDVPHDFENGDWEAHAMFYNARKKFGMSERQALDWMDHKFNDEYPARGMLFAVGNQAKRRHVWQLLGVLRVDPPTEADMAQSRLF